MAAKSPFRRGQTPRVFTNWMEIPIMEYLCTHQFTPSTTKSYTPQKKYQTIIMFNHHSTIKISTIQSWFITIKPPFKTKTRSPKHSCRCPSAGLDTSWGFHFFFGLGRPSILLGKFSIAIFDFQKMHTHTIIWCVYMSPVPGPPHPPPSPPNGIPPPQNLVFACYLHIYIHIYTYILPFPPLQPRISTLFAALESHDLVNGPCLPVYFYHNLFSNRL